MLNYDNLSDVDFENLCQDVMSEMLGIKLRRFAPGRDGGIDLTEDPYAHTTVVQIKHYRQTNVSGLISSLKKELPKVEELSPRQYYICCSKQLSPQNITDIYTIFADYMDSTDNIVTLTEIDDFLVRKEHQDVLKRHCKLWIPPVSIIENLFCGDIEFDSRSLLWDIEQEQKLFVQTGAYNCALAHLEKERILMLTGNPGVGKTLTSKMLVYHYASQKYSVKYTTEVTNLAALKRAINANPDQKEIILLDDCLGQAYFDLKESQGKELSVLIQYIKHNPNKVLLLNSRITILQEARSKTLELDRCLGRGLAKIHTIDMNEVTLFERAQMFLSSSIFSKY